MSLLACSIVIGSWAFACSCALAKEVTGVAFSASVTRATYMTALAILVEAAPYVAEKLA